MDNKTTIKELKSLVATFVKERDWSQFHSPKNLSMDIAVEAAELMEKFLWIESKDSLDEYCKNKEEVEDELADIFIALLCFVNSCDIDLSKAFHKKLSETSKKYPVELVKGRHYKYTHYKK